MRGLISTDGVATRGRVVALAALCGGGAIFVGACESGDLHTPDPCPTGSEAACAPPEGSAEGTVEAELAPGASLTAGGFALANEDVEVRVRLASADAELPEREHLEVLGHATTHVLRGQGALLAGGQRADWRLAQRDDEVKDFQRFERPPLEREVRYEVEAKGITDVEPLEGGLLLLAEGRRPRVSVSAPVLVDADGGETVLTLDVETCVPLANDPAVGLRCELVTELPSSLGPLPATLDPTWALLSPGMFFARTHHSATLLSNGRVLIVGGYDPGTSTVHARAELFDPTTQTFDDVGATHELNTARFDHQATYLPGPPERVLITGGRAALAGPALSSAELYDVASGTFLPVGAMTQARTEHRATALSTGEVLVTGGGATSPLAAEIYQPGGQTFQAVADPMNGQRRGHTSTLLDNGSVLITGGFGAAFSTQSAELFDPNTDLFTLTDGLTSPRAFATATKLNDGRVLVAGGTNGTEHYGTADLYDAAGLVANQTTPMAARRSNHQAVRLASGQILLIGGENAIEVENGLEIFDPTTGLFAADEPMTFPRVFHTATTLASGQVLATGGAVGAPSSSAEILLRSLGDPCTVSGECASGSCAPQGVCCDADCTGICESCLESSTGQSDGMCAPVLSGQSAGGQATQSCDNDIAFELVCDGTGGVMAAGVEDCEPYGCDGDECATDCDAAGGCSDDGYCEVATGTCIEKKLNGLACAGNVECDTGLCIDGVCCATECPGTCQSCAVPGSAGVCALVTGDPIGTDKSCAGADEGCPGFCDGQVAQCSFDDRPCGPAFCDEGVQSGNFCSAGACEQSTSECGAFACDADGEQCLDACESIEDCASGFVCTADGQCAVVEASTCSEGTLLLPNGSSEDCSPYICETGACRESCRSIDDCAGDFVCNFEGRCVAAPAPATAPSGCSLRPPSSPTEGGHPERALWLGLAIALWARSRRSGR